MVASNLFRLITSLTVCYGGGILASLYALPMIPGWYASLVKPGFIPPDPLLLPIGLVTYLLLGLALYFIWSEDPKKRDTGVCLYLFIFGLILNVLWIYVFFGLQSPFMALMIMIMLLSIVLSTIYQSFRVSIAACILLVPYLIGCLIIAIANYYIFVMNPTLPLLVI